MPKPPKESTLTQAARDKAQFARDLARAEFGRFYWDEAHTAEMQRARATKKKRPDD